MKLENLKWFRLVYPGILSVIYIIVYYIGNEVESISDIVRNGNSINISATIPAIAIFVLGAMYYAFGIRNIIWGPVVRKVQNNIVTRLLKIAYQRENDLPNISKRKQFVDAVFYPIVDNDNSLCQKSLLVKQNGVILTCTIDTLLITFLFLIFWLVDLSYKKASISIVFWIILIIFLLAIPALVCLIKKHFRLSNEQLDVIGINYRSKCIEKVTNFMNNAN